MRIHGLCTLNAIDQSHWQQKLNEYNHLCGRTLGGEKLGGFFYWAMCNARRETTIIGGQFIRNCIFGLRPFERKTNCQTKKKNLTEAGKLNSIYAISNNQTFKLNWRSLQLKSVFFFFRYELINSIRVSTDTGTLKWAMDHTFRFLQSHTRIKLEKNKFHLKALDINL